MGKKKVSYVLHNIIKLWQPAYTSWYAYLSSAFSRYMEVVPNAVPLYLNMMFFSSTNDRAIS